MEYRTPVAVSDADLDLPTAAEFDFARQEVADELKVQNASSRAYWTAKVLSNVSVRKESDRRTVVVVFKGAETTCLTVREATRLMLGDHNRELIAMQAEIQAGDERRAAQKAVTHG